MRDEFPDPARRVLASRAGNRCSICGAPTSGPQDDALKAVNVGVAAHITAASPGGPRYDPALSPEERGSASNGIWLCQTHAKLVDNDPRRFTAEQLRASKEEAERKAQTRIGMPIESEAGISITESIVAGDIVAGDKVTTTVNIQTAAYTRLTSLHQLPPPPGDFTGRSKDLDELLTAVGQAGAAISGMYGMGGVGKTALASKLAEELSQRYPDAQFYLDLKGTSNQPLTPAEIMAHVIRSYDPQAKLPDGEAALRGTYRSVLYGKRALLLLDNARDAAQIGSAIPPLSCFLLVTSRQHFTIPGLIYKSLDTLAPDDATALLCRIAPRIRNDEAVALAGLCGHLPLALRAVGSAIATRPDLSPGEYAIRLKDARERLRLTEVEASLSLSYDLLPAESQNLFRDLSVFENTFTSHAATSIWELEPGPADEALGQLLRFSLLEFNTLVELYRLHDLVRLFADARLTPDERKIMQKRHAFYYRYILGYSEELYKKGGDSVRMGLAIIDLERQNIWAGHRWAAENAASDTDAELLTLSYPLVSSCLVLRQHPKEAIAWAEAALHAARSLGDRKAEAANSGNIAAAFIGLSDYPRAIKFSEQQLKIAKEIGDSGVTAAALGNLGVSYSSLSKYREAIKYQEEALQLARTSGDSRIESLALGNLGISHRRLAEYEKASSYFEQQLELAKRLGFRRVEAIALSNLATLSSSLQDHRRSVDFYQEALKIVTEMGDGQGKAAILGGIANAHLILRDSQQAIEYLQRSLSTAREIGDRGREAVALGGLGTAYAAMGDFPKGQVYYEQTLEIAQELGDRDTEGRTLGNLASLFSQQGDLRRALQYYDQRLVIAREIEDREGEANGLANMAAAFYELKDLTRAVGHAVGALKIFTAIGSPRANGIRALLMSWGHYQQF
jgi:tetratricopeptide (TPR) repeat protein